MKNSFFYEKEQSFDCPLQTVKEPPNKWIRKERFPKENHQGFLLASQMRGNATAHGLHSSASARQKRLFDTLKRAVF